MHSGVASLVLAVAALLFPERARADEPVPPEADTSPSRKPPPATGTNLVIVGAALTVGWYGAAVGTSYLWPSSDAASRLRIPVAGAFMALPRVGCGDRESTCGTFDVIVRATFTGLSAVGQVGGLLAIAEGIFLPTAPAAPARGSRPVSPRSHVAIAPAPVGGGGFGLGIVGDF